MQHITNIILPELITMICLDSTCLDLIAYEFELFYLTNNILLPNGKSKQEKLIEHVLVLATKTLINQKDMSMA